MAQWKLHYLTSTSLKWASDTDPFYSFFLISVSNVFLSVQCPNKECIVNCWIWKYNKSSFNMPAVYWMLWTGWEEVRVKVFSLSGRRAETKPNKTKWEATGLKGNKLSKGRPYWYWNSQWLTKILPSSHQGMVYSDQ